MIFYCHSRVKGMSCQQPRQGEQRWSWGALSTQAGALLGTLHASQAAKCHPGGIGSRDYKKRQGVTGEGAVESHKDDEGSGARAVGAGSVVPDSFQWCPATRSNGHKLKHERFHLNMRKNCTLRVAVYSNRLSRESLSMETFKTHLDAFLCDLL